MEQLSRSEEQVMAALWTAGNGQAATRRQIAAALPAPAKDAGWADSTLLNFLLRLERKGFVRLQKQGNKNLYLPLVRRDTYCGAVSAAHLQTLYSGDVRGLLAALSATGRLDRTQVHRLLRWLDGWLAENAEYEYE